jgi:hypothetical protein
MFGQMSWQVDQGGTSCVLLINPASTSGTAGCASTARSSDELADQVATVHLVYHFPTAASMEAAEHIQGTTQHIECWAHRLRSQQDLSLIQHAHSKG